MDIKNVNTKRNVGNKLKGHLAREIETRPLAGKIGFVATDGAYHVFHDMGVSHARNYRDGGEEILEFESDRHLVVIRGFKLEVLVNLFLDSELYRLGVTPEEFQEKHRRDGVCFISEMEIGIAMEDEDDFVDQ